MRAETRLQHDSRVRLQDLSGLTEVVSGGIESYSIWMKDYRTEHASTTGPMGRGCLSIAALSESRSLGVSQGTLKCTRTHRQRVRRD
jgi:hypothetical protein